MSDGTDIIYNQLCICTGGKPKVTHLLSHIYIAPCKRSVFLFFIHVIVVEYYVFQSKCPSVRTSVELSTLIQFFLEGWDCGGGGGGGVKEG